MDSITQGVLGAAIGESILGKKVGYKAAIAGAIIATIPDLDVVLYLFYDKFEMLSIHRGISHSLIFCFLAAAIIAFVLSKLKWLKEISYLKLYLFSWLSLFTHVLLDTFTAYGTQLFLPFSDQRVGFDSINVVDPLYTIPLIVGLVLNLRRSKAKTGVNFNNYGLLISSIYLVFTLCHKGIVEQNVREKLSAENIEFNSLLTMPVGIANMKWYGVAKDRDSIYMLTHSFSSGTGNQIESFAIHDEYLESLDSQIADKMRWFAKGFYTVDKVDDKIRVYNLQVDMRGITEVDGKKVPTMGYFEVSNLNGENEFSSGSVNKSSKQ